VRRYNDEAHEAGGNVDRLVTAIGNLDPKFQPAFLTYSTLWTRRHYDESRAFFEGLLTGPDASRVYVMAFDQLTRNLHTLPWMERVVHVPADSIQNWAARQAGVLAEARALAEVRVNFLLTLRARWVTLRARWVTLRARWVTLRVAG
jgi:hypothetical protein